MSDDQKKQLEQQLWNIANTLRGKMNADEFRDYILGFIFFKYLSEKMDIFADEVLKQDKIIFKSLTNTDDNTLAIIEAVKEEALDRLGYFLKPQELFSEIAKRGNSDIEGVSNFILEDLQKILNNIQLSTMGTDSEEDFDNLFEDMDLNSTKLGKTLEARNEIIAKVLSHLDKIDFKLENSELDILGDAYEYLIGQFASGAGKKAGEFYTPQEVSTILAKIVSTGKEKLKSVYDPTCGSGSLLLRVAREVKDVGSFYGQELNRTTYNLARMNMILHGIHYRKFDIKQEDTLENPQHKDFTFEAIVANPPFSANWSANPLHLTDDRFSQYGKLAPSSKADFAFVQHMIYHLAENGTMAIVLPHGALFRGGAEQHIRQFLIENKNYLDAVIGLPANIFYGTSIPTCIMVYKKCKETPEDVLFIDASQHFEKAKTQSVLREEHIDKIVNTYRNRIEEDKYSRKATLKLIADNNYNLNIPRYVDTFVAEGIIDIDETCDLLEKINDLSIRNDKKISSICIELNIPQPKGNNIFLLKQYKKSVMQKIFSQELRFKDDNGNDYPDWVEKKLGEVLVKNSTKNKNQEFKLVQSVSNKRGFVNQDEYFEDRIIASKDLSNYYVIQKGFFAYNPSRIDVGSLAYKFDNNTSVISPLYISFRAVEDSLVDTFLLEWFATQQFIRQMNSSFEGSVRNTLSYESLRKIDITFPCIEEQTKIANFLSVIDDKINAVEVQIEKMEVWKKGLLQQMFV
jgi:type I restriction enzyme M protein